MISVSILFLMFLAMPLAAQQDALILTRNAGHDLHAASRQLNDAETASDRVKALSQTVKAYEVGLAAMRLGLRHIATREAQLVDQLTSRNNEISQFLTVLQKLTIGQGPTMFLHPSGLNGTVRAEMLLIELTLTLKNKANMLIQNLDDVEMLRTLQEQATEQLEIGLKEVQKARWALNQAMADRTDLPKRYTEDPIRTAILIASSETIDAFFSGLPNMVLDNSVWELPRINDQIGELPLPVLGKILNGTNQADFFDSTRPGIFLATQPGALVTSPTVATLRYVGPLLDLGNVMILELGPGTLLVLAGLGVTFGKQGQVVAAETPLGLMGVLETQGAKNGVSTIGDGGGASRLETLYIEIRQDNVPQDPLTWFGIDKDG